MIWGNLLICKEKLAGKQMPNPFGFGLPEWSPENPWADDEEEEFIEEEDEED
jgi:hypothetical protein